MYLSEGAVRHLESLWEALNLSAKPAEIDKLRESGRDPLSCANEKICEIEDEIKAKYSEKIGYAILKDVRLISAAGTFSTTAGNTTVKIELSLLPEREMQMPFRNFERKDIFTYLIEEYGVLEEDFPVLMEYGNFLKVYGNAVSVLVEAVTQELSENLVLPLSESVDSIEFLNPTPRYPHQSLIYEVINNDKLERWAQADDEGSALCVDDFTYEEMKAFSEIVKKVRQTPGSITYAGELAEVFEGMSALGILEPLNELGVHYRLNTGALNKSTLRIYNEARNRVYEADILEDVKTLWPKIQGLTG